ncbi:MAG TPA: hypothetical protein DIV79_06650 [Opitutae bacterium]|nr:hypothetical protein [Opitutaceae bacterium]HCR29677.1 hypothetical protein [Opitutae bacterium]
MQRSLFLYLPARFNSQLILSLLPMAPASTEKSLKRKAARSPSRMPQESARAMSYPVSMPLPNLDRILESRKSRKVRRPYKLGQTARHSIQ